MTEQIVTGEAVVVDLRLASWPSRAVALFLDVLVQLVILWVLFMVFGLILVGSANLTGGVDAAVAATVLIVIVTLALVVYPVVLERTTHGRSVGKFAMGLRVVRDDGGPVRVRHCLVRALLAVFIDVWTTAGGGGLIASVLNSKGKRLGDILAGTVVVQTRLPAQRQGDIWMPPPLAWWAASLDLSALPDSLVLRARSFLLRSHELSPGVRESFGSSLVAEVGRYVEAAPPGTPGYAYLTAVVAEHRRRAFAHLAPAPMPVPPPAPPAPPPAPPGAVPLPPIAPPPSAPGPFAPPS